MAEAEKPGVAVVGLGVGEQHLHAFLGQTGCRLRWIYDLDSTRSRTVAAQININCIAPDFETILNDPLVKIVCIASYDDAHFEQVYRALEVGKHVFVEKPLCQTHEQLQTIKRIWSRYNGRVKLASNLVLRTAPLYRWLRQIMQAGELGEIYALDGEYLYGRLHKITHGWRKEVLDYSVIAGGGIHLIDLMLWLIGQRPLNAMASGNGICTANTDFRYADYVTANLQFSSGLIGRITANFGCVHRHQHVLRIYGTRGTFLYDDAGPRLHLSRHQHLSASSIDLAPLPASKGELIPAFVSAILNDEDSGLETQTFFDGISISIACDRSLKTHLCEEIEYV